MPSPTAKRLRAEARVLRQTAKRIWWESEELLARATALNADADQMEREADELDDLAEAESFAGTPLRPHRARKAA